MTKAALPFRAGPMGGWEGERGGRLSKEAENDVNDDEGDDRETSQFSSTALTSVQVEIVILPHS